MDAFNFFLFPSLTALSDDCLELEHLIYLGSERCNLFLESECPLLIGLLFSLRSYWNSVNYSAAAATTGRSLVFCLSWMDAHPIPSCAAIRIKSIAFQMLSICTATSCICLSYRTGFVSGLKHQSASQHRVSKELARFLLHYTAAADTQNLQDSSIIFFIHSRRRLWWWFAWE